MGRQNERLYRRRKLVGVISGNKLIDAHQGIAHTLEPRDAGLRRTKADSMGLERRLDRENTAKLATVNGPTPRVVASL